MWLYKGFHLNNSAICGIMSDSRHYMVIDFFEKSFHAYGVYKNQVHSILKGIIFKGLKINGEIGINLGWFSIQRWNQVKMDGSNSWE